jgi:hypothetical protein
MLSLSRFIEQCDENFARHCEADAAPEMLRRTKRLAFDATSARCSEFEYLASSIG